MDLRKAANKFETTSFDIFNEGTQLWESGGLKGKIMPIDRFLSIFHRSTIRRQLGLAPSATLPASNTIRDPATGETFIVGLIRSDSADAKVYDSVGILNKCYSTGQVSRKATIGSGLDLGVLVAASMGVHYMDIELRSSGEVDGASEDYESFYFLTAPIHSDVEVWDYITLNSTSYQVTTVYIDSGLKFCRVIERIDPRINITYHKRGATADYVPGTGVVSDGVTDYQVTGFFQSFTLEDIDDESIFSRDLKFIIDQDHIGVAPAEKDELTFEGQRYKIHAVQQDFLKRQFKLHCRV